VRALAYEKAHALDAYAIQELDVAEPKIRDADRLVEVRAVGVNPGNDRKDRDHRLIEPAHSKATRTVA
jgi:NADPH:quinone reductase-like Zn-dependent oxidoreductase